MQLAAVPAILLFAFSIPVVMKYRILPIEGTPYWLFGVLFFCLIAKVLVDLYPSVVKQHAAGISRALLIVVLLIVVGGATGTAIVDRHRIAPVWGTHDIILQLEAAMRYLIQGKNPYKETYFGTPVEMFRYDEMGKPATNPALYHFVMPPWYLLAPFPVYLVANRTVGYFDGRMVSLLVMAVTLVLLWLMIRDRVLREVAIVLTALSPATIEYFIEGRSDPFALVWLLAGVYFVQKRQVWVSAVCLALGVLSKQTIWFAFPIWAAYLVFLTYQGSLKQSIFMNIKYIFASIGIVFAIALPFILWDAHAFFESVVFYLSAGGERGYPISGYGFSMVLYTLGIIPDLKEFFPFTLLQIGLGIPVLLVCLLWLKKQPRASVLFMIYGLFLFTVWYVSRYFNNSHIAFLSTIFSLGVLFSYDEQLLKKRRV